MIGMSVKSMFFDAKAVKSAVDMATRKVLSRFGAFVRQRAKGSIRSRKAISRPGRPPSSHVGTLKRLIFFGYDAGKKSVVIGPATFNGRTDMELLEQDHVAGTVRRIRRKDRKGKTVSMTYKSRPFMGPAMAAESPKLPDMWRDSVK